MAGRANLRQLTRIAVRNVRGNRRRAVLAGLAVMLGVLAVTTLRGMLNGVQTALRSEAIQSQIGALQIHRRGYMAQVFGTPLDLDLPVDAALLAKIEGVANVKAAAPRINFGAMVSTGDTTTFAMITAIDTTREAKVCPSRHERLSEGELVSHQHPDGLVLSAELARRIGAKRQAGDAGRVAILTNDRDGSLNAVDTQLLGLNGLPRSPGLETRLGVMGLDHARELLRMPGRATEIAVAVHDLRQIEETRRALQAALGSEFEVSTWPELARPVADATALQDSILQLITAILLVVALVGVVNTMLMSVLERTREIGVMLALGMRTRAIVLLFVLEAAVINVVAAAPGLLLAFGLLAVLERADVHFQAPGGGVLHIHPEVLPRDLYVVLTVVVLGALLASIFPALRAAKLRPVDALNNA